MNVNAIGKWVERFNSRDAGCAALYAEDASLHVAFVDPACKGERRFSRCSRRTSRRHRCTASSRLYAARRRARHFGMEDKVGLLASTSMRSRTGLAILRQRNYFDQLTFLRLNGIANTQGYIARRNAQIGAAVPIGVKERRWFSPPCPAAGNERKLRSRTEPGREVASALFVALLHFARIALATAGMSGPADPRR